MNPFSESWGPTLFSRFRGRLGLSSETAEPDMNQRRDDAAYQWSRNVKPGLAEITGRDHRTQRARRIENAARQFPSHDDVEADGHANGERREIARPSGDGRAEHHGNKKESEYGFDHEAICGQHRERGRAECKTMGERGP